MNHFDHLNNDSLALIVQYLPIKELLYFIRTHRRLHLLNSSNASWCSRAFNNSQISIYLNEERFHDHFLSWLMGYGEFVYDRESADDQHREHGFISLSTWNSIKYPITNVWQRWLDDMNKNGCLYSNQEFIQIMNFEHLNCLIEMRDNPATRFITTASGEQCEVLTELNQQKLEHEYGRFSSLCYYPQFVLSATPHLRSLTMIVDPHSMKLPDASEIFSLVPHLRSLLFCQYNESDVPLISVRQTLKCLPELESLTLEFLHPTIQSMIDIACHPRLTHIELDDDGGLFFPAKLDEYWFLSEEGFKSNEMEEEEEENEKTIKKSAKQHFRMNGEDKEEDEGEEECEEATPERMAEDLNYIQSSLSLPSSLISIKARFSYLNWLISILFKPKYAAEKRPLRYLRHLRHQLFIIHTSSILLLSINALNKKKKIETFIEMKQIYSKLFFRSQINLFDKHFILFPPILIILLTIIIIIILIKTQFPFIH